MTSIYRSRERDLPDRSGGGTYTLVTDLLINSVPYPGFHSEKVTPTEEFLPGHELTQDRLTIAGPREPNDLLIEKRKGYPARMSGEYTTPTTPPTTGILYTHKYNGYYGTRLGSMWNTGISSLPSESPQYWLTEFLGRSAIGQPVVDVPLFLWELQEFPQLLRHAGDLLSKKLIGNSGDTWLAYSFGWKPLFNDLATLLNFAEAAHEEVKRAVNAKSQSRIRSVLKNTSESSTVVGSLDLGGGLKVEINDKITTKIWATGQWVLDDPYKIGLLQQFVDNDPSANIARTRHLLGLSRISKSTVWNAIPWSWLLDYFVNMNSFLLATDNSFRVKLKNVCVMIKTIGTETSKVIENPNGLTFSSHSFVRERKERHVYLEPSALPVLNPILTRGRVSNLLALATASRIRARY